jgi:hypothetical protein
VTQFLSPEQLRELESKGIFLSDASGLDPKVRIPFSMSLDGLEGTGKTYFALRLPKPLILVNFGDRPPHSLLYDMSPEERKGIYIKDIQPKSPEGWTFDEAVNSLIELNKIISAAAPMMPGGTFVLDGGSSWWSVMQQVFVEPKEKERLAAGKKLIGGIIYEEANNRVRGVLGHLRASGCFLAITHQLRQDWGPDGPIPNSYSPRKNSQVPYLVEVELEFFKLCATCNAPACQNNSHVGRKHFARIKKLSGNTSLEGMVIENLTFPKLYKMQTGQEFPG